MAEPAPVMVVTGTGTGVGKTVTTAALTVGFQEHGLRVVVVKPAQTGVTEGQPGDLAAVGRLVGEVETHELLRLPDRLAPDTAGRRAGVPLLPVAEHAHRVLSLAARADVDLVLVDRTGGLLVRLDDAGQTLADLGTGLQHRHARVGYVVVARAGLGTLNHSALTAEALRHRDLECLGFVIGAWPAEPDLAARTNLSDLPSVTDAPLLGRIPEGAGGWDPERFRREAPAWLAL